MGEENYEMIYVRLPESYYLDPNPKLNKRQERAADRKREEVAHSLILETFGNLIGEAGRRLKPPIKFRWVEPGGKIVWSGPTISDEAEVFDADAFGIAVVNALNDVKVNVFLEFEGVDGKFAKFCLRFT